MKAKERPLLQVRLTPKARAGIDAIARQAGVNVTALLEALGLTSSTESLDPAVIQKAREIAAQRSTSGLRRSNRVKKAAKRR